MVKTTSKIILVCAIFIAIVIYFLRYTLYKENFNPSTEKTYIYIPTGSGYNDLLRQLENQKILKDKNSFIISAKWLNLKDSIKAGRYIINYKTSNQELINNIKNSKQALVRLALDNIRTKEQLAQLISRNLEATYADAIKALTNKNVASKYNLNDEQFICLFIADTYFLNWNTSIEQFLQIMEAQNKKIWTPERLAKAQNINLTPAQVYILASIVYMESAKTSEQPIIAGLYINRLRRNMPLASDPTVIFATGDLSLKRVRFKHLKNPSPYNTYRYKGLPPGPITTVPVSAIDAVLNYKKHNYLYMSAKDDLSGYHNFSERFSDHKKNADAIRKKFNKLNLK